MPVYCFVCDSCGTGREGFFGIREKAEARCGCGRRMRRDYSAENRGYSASAANSFANGQASNALGVPAYKARAEQEKLRKLPGCASVEVNKKGQVVMRSLAQRKAIVKHFNRVLPGGCVDRDE